MNIAIHQLDTRCHQLQLAIASYWYLRRFKLDWNGSKGNVGLLNEQNGARGIANHQLATSCDLLQLASVISTVTGWLKMVHKGILVYSMIRRELGTQLVNSFPLGTNSCSQLQLAADISAVSSLIEMAQMETCLLNQQNETMGIAIHQLTTQQRLRACLNNTCLSSLLAL